MDTTIRPAADSPFLTTEEAAAYCRLSVRYLETSTCPRIHKGRRVLWDRLQLDAWMRADATPAVGGPQGVAA